MGWIFQERPDSRDFTRNPDGLTLRYVCGRHPDAAYINAYSIAATPYIFDGLYRQSLTAKHLGGGMWNVDVPYGTMPEPSAAAYRIRYDTTGGTARITQALSHIASYARSGETAPDHGGAINVGPDGRVEGVDKIVPAFSWSEEHTLPVAICGWSYSQILKALTGHVNNASFRGFATGEVLFNGAIGAYSSDADTAYETQVTFNFEHQDSITSVTYDDVTGVTKVGWEYLWFEHAQEDDSTAKRLKSPLIAVHREKVYEAANFALMGIGS